MIKMMLSFGFTPRHASRSNNFKSGALWVDNSRKNPMEFGRSIKWLVFFILTYSLGFGCCKRQKPRPNEIERIVNDTHSIIWKCPNCAFGQGLNVQCGSSIDFNVQIQCADCVEGFNYSDSHGYAQCKTCRNCAENEETSGQCLKDDDTTRCLGRCHKGYYWENLSASCQQCSHCCGESFQLEKQCENAGLPITHQCRQAGIKCQHPTTVTSLNKKQEHNHRNPQRKNLTTLEVVAIVVCTVLFIIVVIIIVIIVMWKWYGWHETKNLLRKCFCFCCHTVNSINGVTRHVSDEVYDERDLESTSLKGSDVHLEATDEMGPLLSAPLIVQVKRPGFKRLSSVPVDTCSKVKSVMPRSRSHPGCLGKLGIKEQRPENKTTVGQKCGIKERIRKKKLKMGGYATVSTEPDPADAAVPVQAGTQTSQQFFPFDPLHQIGSDLHHHRFDKKWRTLSDAEKYRIKMQEIPFLLYHKVCLDLDIKRGDGKDVREFANKLNISVREHARLQQEAKIQNRTTTSVILDQKPFITVGEFADIMKEMERQDIVDLINE